MNYVLTPSAVSKLRRALAKPSGNTGAALAPASAYPDRYPPPFTVRWSASAASGEGAWVIWLPSTPTLDTGGQQRIILIGDQYYQINSLNSASGLPPGWYILPNSASGGDVWFNVTYPYRIGSSSIVAGAIQTARAFRPEDQVDGYYRISVHIASMETDAETGAKKVYQFVDSQINLAQLPMTPGGGGGDEDIDAPLPYEVRFDKDLASGGAWKIYLPTEHLLLYNGEYIDTSNFGGITSIGDGWYSFDGIDRDDSHVWLVITDSGEESGSGDSPITVEISATKGMPSVGEKVENICIAELSYTANGGDSDPTVEVWQSAIGALIVDKKADAVSTPFQYTVTPGEQGDTRQIENCVFYFNGEQKTLPTYSSVPQSGTVYLTGTLAAPESGSSSEPQWQFAVATSPAQTPTGGKAINIKLYDFSGGKMTMDYRTTFLTLCSNENETIEPDDVSTEFVPEAAPGTTPTGDEGKLQIKGFKAGTPVSASTLGANLSNPNSGSSSGHVLVRTTSGALEYKPIGSVAQTNPDGVSTDKIPDPPQGEQSTGDEGKLEIKGFKAGSPTANTLPAYLQGAAQLPSNGVFLVARTVSDGGVASLVYIPLSKIFQNQGDDISVEFVRDNDWDSTDHVLRKRMQILNLCTGAVTDKAGTTYANGWEIMARTTPISSLLPSSSS